MSRARQYSSLIVGMNGKEIGVFTRSTSGEFSFEYHSNWIENENSFSISRSIALTEGRQKGQNIIAYFENLLPDSQAILKHIATRLGAAGTDAHSLLNKIGADCVGALQFTEDVDALSPPNAPLRYEAVSEYDIESILNNLKATPLGIEPEGEFRISIAGAQEKTALLKLDEGWAKPLGATPTTHIFKPSLGQIGMDGINVDMSNSVANEHYCMELMRQFNLKTARTEMMRFGSKEVLVVERFDRELLKGGGILRKPQEDMCQALGCPPTLKYQSAGGPSLNEILDLLSGSDQPHKDMMTVFKANLIFWLIGATDGHAKNFSIFLTPGGGYRLTPLYDVLSLQLAKDAKQLPFKNFKLALSVGCKPHYKIDNIHGRHFLETAMAANLPKDFAREAIRDIQDQFDAAFENVKALMPDRFPFDIHNSIFEGAKSRLPKLESAFE